MAARVGGAPRRSSGACSAIAASAAASSQGRYASGGARLSRCGGSRAPRCDISCSCSASASATAQAAKLAVPPGSAGPTRGLASSSSLPQVSSRTTLRWKPRLAPASPSERHSCTPACTKLQAPKKRSKAAATSGTAAPPPATRLAVLFNNASRSLPSAASWLPAVFRALRSGRGGLLLLARLGLRPGVPQACTALAARCSA